MSTHTTQNGQGGFHGQPVTSLPQSAVSGSSASTRWQSSSPGRVPRPRGLVRSSGAARLLTQGRVRRRGSVRPPPQPGVAVAAAAAKP